MVSSLDLIAEQIKARARAELLKPKMTPSGLAKLAGLHENTLRDMEGGDWKPSYETLRKLELHLNAPAERVAA